MAEIYFQTASLLYFNKFELHNIELNIEQSYKLFGLNSEQKFEYFRNKAHLVMKQEFYSFSYLILVISNL